MSKHTTRAERRRAPSSRPRPRPAGETGSPGDSRSTIERPARIPAGTRSADFSQEYRYVIEDLQRIAILAVVLVAVLVVLGFLIR